MTPDSENQINELVDKLVPVDERKTVKATLDN
jgi:hypothetical protein